MTEQQPARGRPWNPTPEEREVLVARTAVRSLWVSVPVALAVLMLPVLSWWDAQARHLTSVHTRGFSYGDPFPWYLFVAVAVILGVPQVLATRRLRKARRALKESQTATGLLP